MHGTRERVLAFVVERHAVRVEELAAELGVTAAAVRRHLDNLRADGLVEVRAVKQATGRPYYEYHPTEAGVGVMPVHYADLMERMLRSVAAKDEVVSAVAASVAEAMAERHRRDLRPDGDASPEARVGQVTESLKGEGILREWHSEADGFHLVNDSCPYLRAAEISKLPCESDRQAIELLLGLDVEQLNRIVDGSPICEYLVRHESAKNGLIEAQGVS
ncbi:MAG: MarR family transcriptional regulator [Dehalococcoidia bacterium]